VKLFTLSKSDILLAITFSTTPSFALLALKVTASILVAVQAASLSHGLLVIDTIGFKTPTYQKLASHLLFSN